MSTLIDEGSFFVDPEMCRCGESIYEWLEEPGEQSRVLEWVRVCRSCGYSPDREAGTNP